LTIASVDAGRPGSEVASQLKAILVVPRLKPARTLWSLGKNDAAERSPPTKPGENGSVATANKTATTIAGEARDRRAALSPKKGPA